MGVELRLIKVDVLQQLACVIAIAARCGNINME